MHLQPTVIAVGSINADLVARVPVMPQPGETVTGSSFEVVWGGKGANQAAAAAALGARVMLVAAVGDDDHGMGSVTDLRERGVDTAHVTVGGEPTGVALILVDDTGENSITVIPGANGTVTADQVTDAFASLDVENAVVVSNLEVPIEAVQRAAELADERHWPFVLNPAPARPLPAALLEHVTVATPNETEAETLGSVRGLLDAGVDAVVVTRGGEGADIHTATGEQHVPASPARPIDTVGAGDAFTAALAVAIGSGRALDDAVRWAAAVGAIATESRGARLPRLEAATIDARVVPGGAASHPSSES